MHPRLGHPYFLVLFGHNLHLAMSFIQRTRLTTLVTLGALLFLLPSCDGLSDFGDMNEDPTAANDMTPDFEFTALQVGTAGSRYEVWRHNLIYTTHIAQHMAFPLGGLSSGGFNAYVDDFSGAFFTANYYGGVNLANFTANVKNSVNLVNRLQDDPVHVNRLAAARIWKVLVFQRLTDTYGDIPYFEAGKGVVEGEFSPAYDSQQEIYQDMHDELQAAIGQFDSSQPTYGEADLVFGGDIEQWKRFANSLQLRLALRIKEVEPNTAQQWADEAINSDAGVMQSLEDEVYIPHQSGPSTGPAGHSTNANNEVFNSFPGIAPHLAEPFVSWMKDNDDPRLPVVAAVYELNDSGEPINVSTDPADQKGMPVGVAEDDLEDERATYSRPNPIITDLDDPFYLQSYAEVEFMLAEAEVEWGLAPNSAEAHYEAGVRAAMEKLRRYDGGGAATIDEAEINDYLQNGNPFDPSRALEQINTQYWAVTFPHGLEAWSNWRVTGYPDLDPPPEQGDTGGQIIRRLAYPQEEENLNQESYNEARSNQGITQGNQLTRRVWWDVE